MKIARASAQDIDAALALVGLLDTIGKGYYPTLAGHEGENEPTFVDDDNPEHLRRVWDCLKQILDRPCSPSRAIFGGCTLLDPRNRIIDPDDDVIALHPRLVAAASLRTAAAAAVDLWDKSSGEMDGEQMEVLRAALVEPVDFRDRVRAEHADLVERTSKLREFVQSAIFRDQPEPARNLLTKKLGLMLQLDGVLSQQIAGFHPTEGAAS